MAARYKVVGRAAPRQRKDSRRFDNVGRKPEVPDAAIDLAENIVRLEQMIELAKRIESRYISDSETVEQRDFCYYMLMSQTTLMQTWLRCARRRLATQYLAP